MSTIRTIYLTLLHVIALGSVWLYTNDNYALVKVEHEEVAQATCCKGDELTALLDKHIKGRK